MKTKLLFIILIFFTLNNTAQNISLVKDINLGADNTLFSEFKVYNNNIIFYATTENHGRELWMSDGTESGTNLLQDINPGNVSSLTTHLPGFTEFQGKLFFNAFDDVNGYELWVTNGSTSGTHIIDDINPGNKSSLPKRFISIDNNTMYFNANTENHGQELWRTDGTALGTYLVTDNYPGTVNGAPGERIVLNGKIIFNASNPTENDVLTSGNELRELDNFSIGLIKDINPGTGASSPTDFFRYNDKVYFSANDGTNGFELWSTTGTENSTVMIKNIAAGGTSSSPSNFIAYNGSIYFTANDGVTGRELWKTNGSESSTSMVRDMNENGSSNIHLSNAVEYAGNLYFWADNGSSGLQLWTSNGTSSGTRIVKTINNTGSATATARIKLFNNKMYFIATDGVNNYKLWESDGTEQGTKMVDDNSDIILSYNYASEEDGVIKQDDLHIINNKLYFIGYNSNFGQELFMYNPNEGKTYVPDNNFEQALIDLGYDDVLDDYVVTNNINTITSLNLENKNMEDLTGIEDFSALQNISIRNNNLSTINISGNINLAYLYCANNNLSSLDVTSNTELLQLDFSNNSISEINLSNNNKIQSLTFSNNNLSSINLSNLTDLDWLIFTNNNISELDITNNTNIRVLNFNDNNVLSLDASNKLLLENISCTNNNLQNINVNGNTALKTLKVDFNSLSSLDISTNTALENLTAINNNLSCIQVADVNLANTNWSDDIDAHATFSTDCSNIWTVNVDPTVLTVLHSIGGIDTNNDGNITLAEAAALTGGLDLSSRGITSVEGLQAFTNITTLDLAENSIVDLSPLTGLEIEIINRNSGKSQRISSSIALENLIINNNSFESINLNSLTNLKEVDISNNPDLATISFKNRNNTAITSFNSTNTPKLSCIIVDDKNAGYLNTWVTDNANNFVANEQDCRQTVLSVDGKILEEQITIYPNPAKEILNIKLSNQVEFNKVSIINITGKIVLKSVQKSINISHLSKGFYFLKIDTNKGSIFKKILKN